MYYIYMIRCKDNSIYTGITNNLIRRMKEHFERNDKCAKYTLSHPANKLECAWQCENRSVASKLEYCIKKLTKIQKEKLIENKNLENIFSGHLESELYTIIKLEK